MIDIHCTRLDVDDGPKTREDTRASLGRKLPPRGNGPLSPLHRRKECLKPRRKDF